MSKTNRACHQPRRGRLAGQSAARGACPQLHATCARPGVKPPTATPVAADRPPVGGEMMHRMPRRSCARLPSRINMRHAILKQHQAVCVYPISSLLLWQELTTCVSLARDRAGRFSAARRRVPSGRRPRGGGGVPLPGDTSIARVSCVVCGRVGVRCIVLGVT